MKIFITGPITGIKDGNERAFGDAASRLAQAGFGAIYWCERHSSPDVSGSASMLLESAREIINECDGLALLQGWEHDQAALRLRGICLDIGYPPVKTVDEWIECSLSKTEERKEA